MSNIEKQETQFITDLKEIVNSARRVVYAAVNFAQVQQNWLIGQRIVVQEQGGKSRAEYGKHIIELASASLTTEFGKGFSITNIKNFRAFYQFFSDFYIGQSMPDVSLNQMGQSVPDQFKKQLPLLSWTHFERLLRVKDGLRADIDENGELKYL
ncbi:MAG: DUF1016 N-terminal domain-containing protein [Paludibacteraceae bacterium]|nr:hypothetical protein [Prevotellaceae bacterium]